VHAIRAFLRTNRHLALGLVALALVIKALVPAGYMLSSPVSDGTHILTVAICGDASGAMTRQIAVTTERQSSTGNSGEHAKAQATCAWGLLAMAGLGAADAMLLALALAFILALGLAPSRPAARRQRAFLRPPLRGPPAFA
jgi:hypothetical protein